MGDSAAVSAGIGRLKGQTQRLRSAPIAEVVEALGRTGERFTDDRDELRRRALGGLPASAGLSEPMARAVLDGMARDWSTAALWKLVESEFEEPAVLDRFTTVRGRRVAAVGPSLCVQILAGTVPGVGVGALIRSLLVKAPTLVKVTEGDRLLPTLFAEGLQDEAGWLADALDVRHWSRGSEVATAAAVAAADVVVVYGSDRTVGEIRASARATTRVIGHHHRFGVGVVGADALETDAIERTAADVAYASAMFDQRGCVSTQVVFVQGGRAAIEAFASYLAAAMERLEDRLPAAPRDATAAASLQQLRGTAELIADAGGGLVLHGGMVGDWTVLVEEPSTAGLPPAGRFVRLRSFTEIGDLGSLLGPWGEHLQTVGIAGFGGREEEVATICGHAGAARIVGFRAVPFPAPEWYHDGRAPLRELVRWVERSRG